MRPHQWTKNALLFAALLFAKRLFVWSDDLKTVAGFGIFCLLSSAVYIVNDLIDLEKDRQHPTKKTRPFAAGDVSRGAGIAFLAMLLAAAIPASFALARPFGTTALAYLALQVAYSLSLKNVVILDVLLVATGFVLRAVAGAQAISVFISPWLIVCTMLLALFLGLSKRRAEIVLLSDKAADHRGALAHYSPYLLDQMISVVTASTVMAYGLYTLWPVPGHAFRQEPLYLTIPFVMYGIFRYLYLIHHREQGGNPSQVLLSDRPLLAAIFLWALAVVAILYFF
ncbi:MAG: decaprenyl-phosphate phosphoribosyltransferase [Acidobacteriota bacterium]